MRTPIGATRAYSEGLLRSPSSYITRGFTSLHAGFYIQLFLRTPRALGPVSPDTLSVATTTAFGCRRGGYSLLAVATFSWRPPQSGAPASWATGALEGPLCQKRTSLCSCGGSRWLRQLPPAPPFNTPG